MNFPHRVLVCVCRDHKRDHWLSVKTPQGPCRLCPCKVFTPEPVCVCGHGLKAHARGPCHEGDGCKQFRLRPEKGGKTLRKSP